MVFPCIIHVQAALKSCLFWGLAPFWASDIEQQYLLPHLGAELLWSKGTCCLYEFYLCCRSFLCLYICNNCCTLIVETGTNAKLVIVNETQNSQICILIIGSCPRSQAVTFPIFATWDPCAWDWIRSGTFCMWSTCSINMLKKQLWESLVI